MHIEYTNYMIVDKSEENILLTLTGGTLSCVPSPLSPPLHLHFHQSDIEETRNLDWQKSITIFSLLAL